VALLRRLSLLLSLAAAAGPICIGAAAGEADDGARVREGVRSGRLVSPEQVVGWVADRYHGRLLEVAFDAGEEEEEEEAPTYEVEWLTPAGHVIEFDFDARDGSLLKTDGRGIEEAKRP
jgi:uncharacterized membrane protein YkoI